MGEYTKSGDAVDKLVSALNGKFNGLKFDVWKRAAQSVIGMRHAGISDTLEGRPCPEPTQISLLPSSIRCRPSRAVTRSQAADETDTQPGETPLAETAEILQSDAGSTPVDTAHLLPSSSGYSTLSAATSVLWATDDEILTLEDTKNWHSDNRLLFGFLFLSIPGAASSFLLQFKPKRGKLANGKTAWDGMVTKCKHPTRQRRRIMNQQLNQMVMTDGQDPNFPMKYTTYGMNWWTLERYSTMTAHWTLCWKDSRMNACE